MKTKKIARIGMFVAAAFVLGYVESLIPLSLGIPGIKIGLSNIVVMLALYEMKPGEAFGIAMTRIFLMGITFGSFSTLMYSLAGGFLSFFVMFFLKRGKWFSVYGVSIAGGVCHNIGQLLVAAYILRTSLLAYYLPFLLVAGCISGVAVGVAASLLIKRLHSLFQE